MALTDRVEGQTTVGSDRISGCTLSVNTKLGSASGIVLVDTAGVEYVLWVDATGDLRVGTRANFLTPDAAGTVVGGQS